MVYLPLIRLKSKVVIYMHVNYSLVSQSGGYAIALCLCVCNLTYCISELFVLAKLKDTIISCCFPHAASCDKKADDMKTAQSLKFPRQFS